MINFVTGIFTEFSFKALLSLYAQSRDFYSLKLKILQSFVDISKFMYMALILNFTINNKFYSLINIFSVFSLKYLFSYNTNTSMSFTPWN